MELGSGILSLFPAGIGEDIEAGNLSLLRLLEEYYDFMMITGQVVELRIIESANTFVKANEEGVDINLPAVGGNGTGLTIDITTSASVITSGSVVNPGNGYSQGDVVTVNGNGTLGTFQLTVEAGAAGNMWVEFMLKSERSSASIIEASEKIKYVSGVPYKNPKYKDINSVGRSWIFEFTLAICKEMLGYIRGKYETIPIPNAEITLNQADLIAAAREEKEALLASLRAFFDETSREKLLERRTMESNFVMEELDRVPRVIYIG